MDNKWLPAQCLIQHTTSNILIYYVLFICLVWMTFFHFQRKVFLKEKESLHPLQSSYISLCIHNLLSLAVHLCKGSYNICLCLSTITTNVVAVQLLSCVHLFATAWTAACQALLTSFISQRWLKFVSIELMMLFNYLILCCPPSPPAFNHSQLQGLFQRVGSSHQAAKVLDLQLQHVPFQWIFRTDFL